MFDRLRNSSRDHGAPAEKKKLDTWQKSRAASRSVKGGDSHYQYSIRGGPPPPRPPREPQQPPERSQQNYQNLQPAPAVQAPNQYRASNYGRPVSSVYSQPSPAAPTFAAHQLRVQVPYSDPNEISPPSSPDALSPQDEPNPGDVSPIDETLDMSQLAISPRGPPKNDARPSIPAMRRERRKNSDAALNALRESKSRERLKQPRPYGHDVRWDPNTGEPTTDSAKGRPSQINPQLYAQGLGDRAGSVSPPQTKPAQPAQTSFGDRLRRIRQPSGTSQPEPAPAPRPAWRGASGRTTLVDPVNDKKDVPPLKVPRKSSKRAGREANVLSPSALSPIASVDSVPSPQPPSPSIAVTNSGANPQTYPSPPLSDDNMTPVKSSAHQSLQVPSNEKAVRRKPTGGPSHQPQPSWSSSVYSEQETQPTQALPDTSQDNWTQPPSRFSITTYATSDRSTPRESVDEAPPMPSILDRKRPVVSGFESGGSSHNSSPIEPVKISLDSYYTSASAGAGKGKGGNGSGGAGASKGNAKSSSTSAKGVSDARPGSPGDAASKDKSLPPAPPETQSLQAQDRVAQLDARLRALGNRRINLNTAIKQMTELMPTDNILASEAVARRREDEKRKVDALRRELAEVERESYELGLKLHRAYKRLDRDAEYEPTTLWVRRVTGA